MAHELDLDDAVANVSSDRARRELEELRVENARLKKHLQQVLDDASMLEHVDPETLNNIEVEVRL